MKVMMMVIVFLAILKSSQEEFKDLQNIASFVPEKSLMYLQQKDNEKQEKNLDNLKRNSKDGNNKKNDLKDGFDLQEDVPRGFIEMRHDHFFEDIFENIRRTNIETVEFDSGNKFFYFDKSKILKTESIGFCQNAGSDSYFNQENICAFQDIKQSSKTEPRGVCPENVDYQDEDPVNEKNTQEVELNKLNSQNCHYLEDVCYKDKNNNEEGKPNDPKAENAELKDNCLRHDEPKDLGYILIGGFQSMIN